MQCEVRWAASYDRQDYSCRVNMLRVEYNRRRKLTYVLILIELPAEGGIPMTQPLYNTFGTFNTFNTLHGMFTGKR